jgi:hypothetical protein
MASTVGISRVDVAASFKELVDVTNKEVAYISSLSALRSKDGGKLSPAAENHLIVLSSRLDELEERLDETTNFVASEKEALKLIESIGDSANENSRVLTHLSNSLPKYLPGTISANASDASAVPTKAHAETAAAATRSFATLHEFDLIPSSIRERSTLEEVNACLSAIQGLAKANRALIDLPRSKLSGKDKARWALLQDQKTNEGEVMISDPEIQSILPLKKNGRISTRCILNTLRALGRISMHSANGKSHYVVH